MNRLARALLSYTYLITRQHDKALEEAEKSIALGPNSADAHAWYAQVLVFAGEPAKGISLVEKALRLNPFPQSWYYNGLYWSYFLPRDYERAIQACMKGITIDPVNIRLRVNLTLGYVMLGLEKKHMNKPKKL